MSLLFHISLPEVKLNEKSEVYGKLELEEGTYEPIGQCFEDYWYRQTHKHITEGDESSSSDEEEEEEDDFDDEDDNDAYLIGLDPREWKDQDHYVVLGLSRLRYRASQDQIKKAHKKKVLKHHPDKRSKTSKRVEKDDDYFTCIQKAYELLSTKQRAYDSVDPTFDDSIPQVSEQAKKNFFSVFTPVFERNKRWSKKKRNIPDFGCEDTPFEQVDNFYNFWYNLDSWREFSYKDEEDKEKGEDRYERRWLEKQNKAARLKLKKEEMQRIRHLVDNAYACDPRILNHRQQLKDRRQAEKNAKAEAVRFKKEEELRIKQEAIDAEKMKKQRAEEETKARLAAQRKEKETQKKNVKREKKMLRNHMKDVDYLTTTDQDRIQHMHDLDRIIEASDLDTLTVLNEAASSTEADFFRTTYQTKLSELNAREEVEKVSHLREATEKKRGVEGGEGGDTKGGWTDDEVSILIKAVNLFPAGTTARWDTIANFLQQHVQGSSRSAKEVLSKAKLLQKNDGALKEEANKKAFEKFSKDTHTSPNMAEQEASQRYESAAEVQVYEVGSNPAPWSSSEQKVLEQALRTYPASVSDRWDKISECIQARSKKDCMKRYKELVELIKAKKLAQISATHKK